MPCLKRLYANGRFPNGGYSCLINSIDWIKKCQIDESQIRPNLDCVSQGPEPLEKGYQIFQWTP